jgi:hypothetical protein
MSDTVVELLATHIAKSMVKSCQRACGDSQDPDPDNFVNAMLNKETIEMIVNQIKNDEWATPHAEPKTSCNPNAPDLNVCKINIKYMMHCIICFHNTIHVAL